MTKLAAVSIDPELHPLGPGRDELNVERYQFRTRGELDAFMHGVGEALLRIEYTVVDRNGQEIPADVDPVQVFAPTLVAVDE